MTDFYASYGINGVVFCGCSNCSIAFQSFDPLTVIVSGLTVSTCTAFPDEDSSINLISTTGITGSFSGNYGTGFAIGSLREQPYGVGDQTCTTPQGPPIDQTVSIIFTCKANRIFPRIQGPSAGVYETLFSTTTGGEFGDVILNDITSITGRVAIVNSVQIFPAP